MKNMLKAAAFLLVGAILIGWVSQVLNGKWTEANKETYTSKEFYELEKQRRCCIFGQQPGGDGHFTCADV